MAGRPEEARALKTLQKLPQPVTLVGDAYAYHADVKKDPYTWYSSDGGKIKVKDLHEIGEYVEKYIAEEWYDFLDEGWPDLLEYMVDYGHFRAGKKPVDQPEHEYRKMMGDSAMNTKNIEICEDWGSSDMSIAVKSMQDYIDKYCDGKINPETIQDAALHAAEFYYDAMGHSFEEAERVLIGAYMRRMGFDKLLAPKEGINELKHKYSWIEQPEYYSAYLNVGRGYNIDYPTKKDQIAFLKSSGIPFKVEHSEYQGMMKVTVPAKYARRLDKFLHPKMKEGKEEELQKAEKHIDDFVKQEQDWAAWRKKKGHDIQSATPNVIQAKPKESVLAVDYQGHRKIYPDNPQSQLKDYVSSLKHIGKSDQEIEHEIARFKDLHDMDESLEESLWADIKDFFSSDRAKTIKQIALRLEGSPNLDKIIWLLEHAPTEKAIAKVLLIAKALEPQRLADMKVKLHGKELHSHKDIGDIWEGINEAYSDPSGLWAAAKHGPQEMIFDVMYRAKTSAMVSFFHKKVKVRSSSEDIAQKKVREYFAKKYPEYDVYSVRRIENED